ncbi:MAG TPA: YciI family protein [Solirubrobacteraceae bacterium]|jgi:hypothetical protein|nr:YciI family protein [Solirubrobacteraceae bacterium]
MRYLIQIFTGESASTWEQLSETEQADVTAEYMAIAQEAGIAGGDQLQPAETATTVRVRDGATLTTDGPFAETKEALGGYYLLDADDLDAAVALAARIPAARLGGAVEIRPVVQR